MESPPESVDYFTAGTTEKDQGSKVGQVVDEHESLAQHLKRLFLYCSLFPSGYEFSKDELIQLWIAEGFIRERQNQRMEDTASEHFNSLEKEGFFVLSRCDFTSVLSAPTENLGNFLYKVNPIKHSILGDTISSGNYFRAMDGKLDGASEMTRHLSLICEDIDGMTFPILQNFKHLRTLHLLSCRGSSIKHVPRDLCFSLTFLRTLNLSGTLISELPSSIGNVKSLRYIDASHTPISRLPESIDSLHKLQTIKLRGCMHFVQLPKGMKKLSNLRHIDLDIIRQLDSMPAYIGNLSNLQTLPAFLVGRDDGCRVGELKNLNDLKGAFNISRLENVLSKEEAEEAALVEKKCIHSLELRWSNLFVEYADQQEKVLECLQPHFGLKGLQIQQYSGSILPTWISNPAFADLVAITLYRCRNCKLLPCMGQLPALKSLSIIEVNEVKKINHQFLRSGPVDHAFPKLERLEFDIMLNLKEWMDVQMGDLPSLVKLIVDSCPELVTFPPLSCLKSLKHLEFRRCPKLLSLPVDGLPSSLESLLILDCACLELNKWCLDSASIHHRAMSLERGKEFAGGEGSSSWYLSPSPTDLHDQQQQQAATPSRSRYELQKMRDWNTFGQYKFPIPFTNCFHSSPGQVTQRLRQDGKNEEDFRIFSSKDLKSATNDFHSSNKLGEGGFGSVYKGKLRDGTLVAIKVLSIELESMRGEREFIAALSALSVIRHENLVKLKGCCVDGAARFLVYDYMKNNSLTHTLLGGEQNRMKFSWDARRNISLGIARGLAYLHFEVEPHILHRDIKSSNILLDENFTPKVGDFGLSKLLRENNSHISTRVAGTLGYIAPEYAISGHLTRKSDVYSFGVLLLEIVSGRAIVDFDMQLGEQYLVQKAWESYKADNLLQLVDPTLQMNFPKDEALRFLKIGLLCVQEMARLRPRMTRAVEMLAGEVDLKHYHISQPGLVSDFTSIKMGQHQSSDQSTFSRGSGASSTQNRYSSEDFGLSL